MQLKINLYYILEPGYARNQFLFLKELKDMGTAKIRVTLEKTRKRLEKKLEKHVYKWEPGKKYLILMGFLFKLYGFA